MTRETLRAEGKDFVEFNFIKQRTLIKIFQSAIDNDADKFLDEVRVAAKRVIKMIQFFL